MFIGVNHTHFGTTVKPLNKGHVGDNINSHALSLVERLSSSRRFKLYCYYMEKEFSGSQELSAVDNTVSLSQSVHHQRFYCMYHMMCFAF